MGVSIRFSCSPFYQLDFNNNLCCISKSMMKHKQNQIENRTYSDLVIIIESACLLSC